MESYIKLNNFPINGMSVTIGIAKFEVGSNSDNFFEIKKLKDNYSSEFIRRSTEYIALWNRLPGERKNDVLDLISPISQVTVKHTDDYGKKVERTYSDVFVVNYKIVSFTGTHSNYLARAFEWLTFRSRKAGDWQKQKTGE